MYKRVYQFLNKYKILYKYQFGFRENHSTIMALTEIVDNILQDLENGKHVAGVYLDLSKAFDTVDHDILLSKLRHNGIRGQGLKWFESYLSNRKQFTYINGKQSKLNSVSHGVPQGSVLGPLLFLIYTNDIVNCTKPDVKTRLFADDTNGFITSNSPKQLKHSIKTFLSDIFTWCNDNKLTVNLNKTCYTIFKSRRITIPDYLNNININNNTIKRVPSVKYLGIILDENLNFDEHIDNLNNSIIKTDNSLKIIKRRVHEENKKLLYYAYVYSKIQYGIEVYGRAKLSTLKRVQTQQNRALKILYSKDYRTPTKTLYKDLDLLMVTDIYKICIAKFVYKQKNGLLPEIFDNLFKENNQVHSHNTRQINNIHHKRTRNNYGQITTENQGTNIWNSIPVEIRNLKTMKNFCRKLRISYLNAY